MQQLAHFQVDKQSLDAYEQVTIQNEGDTFPNQQAN